MKNGEELAEVVADYVNGSTKIINEFTKKMLSEHPTLQQNFTRLCVAWLEALAKVEYCDLRNEASVELAKLFVETIPPEKRALPYI